jgi:phosphoglycolate phosphatase-like HAD superfamily hydrolase
MGSSQGRAGGLPFVVWLQPLTFGSYAFRLYDGFGKKVILRLKLFKAVNPDMSLCYAREKTDMRFNPQSGIKLLALDAMGVIYAEANDGPNLLYPFIVQKGGCSDVQEIIRLYSLASIGKISSVEFWKSAGVDPGLEDEYLLTHRLSEGLAGFLDEMRSCGTELWCLSNDVSEWSRKLRERFGLDRYFRGFVISGDIGIRKPDAAIYHHLLGKSGYQPQETLFVDDRLRNIEAAGSIGIASVLFNPAPEESRGHIYPIAKSFAELLSIMHGR